MTQNRDKVVYVSTSGGWVSFRPGSEIDLRSDGCLVITRDGETRAFFKQHTWFGFVYEDPEQVYAPEAVKGMGKQAVS